MPDALFVFKRKEKKYLLSEKDYNAFISRAQEYLVKDSYGEYTICNIYYDTQDYSLIRRSIEKPQYKEKLRLRSYGVPLTDGEDAGVVCVGFDTTLTYEKLERAVHFIRRGAAFVAANPDWVCPMAAGEVMPDCGSICALLTASTGVKPLYIGKPNRDMVDIISNHTGVPNSVICCVGDRLYTDIAVAVNAGAQSVLVMSGETTPEILAESETKPGWVMADVAELADVLKG